MMAIPASNPTPHERELQQVNTYLHKRIEELEAQLSSRSAIGATDTVPVPRELCLFLMGVGHIDGVHFGEPNWNDKRGPLYTGRVYWWRELLSEAMNAAAPAASPPTRCSVSFAHPAHDFCDGNPDGGNFGDALKPAASPQQEQCSYCREFYPQPVSLHHSEDECAENIRLENERLQPLLAHAKARLAGVAVLTEERTTKESK